MTQRVIKMRIEKPPRANWRAWHWEEVAMMRRMAGTATAAQIAAQLGRGVDSVKHMARANKISLKLYGERAPGAIWSDADVEAVRQLHDDGTPPREIRRRFPHITPSGLHDILYYRSRLGPIGEND